MSPALAAFLCTGFIAWLFYTNAKRSRGVSLGLWIPTIWVAIMGSKPLGLWFVTRTGQLDFKAYLEGSPLDRNVSLLLIFLGFIVLAKRRVQWAVVIRENQWLFLLYLYLLISVIWSDYTFVAFKRWIRDAASVVMILVIMSEDDPVEATRQVFVRCAYLLIPLSVLTMKYYINIGRYYDEWTGAACLCGVTAGKNQLGRLAMTSGIFLLWSLWLTKSANWIGKLRERWPDAVVLGLCVMILAQADSATSKLCFGLGTTGLLLSRLSWLSSRPQRLICIGLALIALSVLFLAVPDLRGIVTGSLHRNVNLTERTDVWDGCLGLGTNPLIGAGFSSVWLTPGAIALGARLQIEEAHNGYLETYLNSGLIGLCLLFSVLLTAGKNAIRQVTHVPVAGSLYTALFLSGVIYNYTEAAFDNDSLVAFFLWLVALRYQPAALSETNVAILRHGKSGPDATNPSPEADPIGLESKTI